MAAMQIDSLTLDDIRTAIVAGNLDSALQTIDCLTATAPRTEARQATSKQRFYLHTLTSGGWANHWKVALLPIADASRMIEELTTEGVTEWEGVRYIINEKAAKRLGKKTETLYAATDGIPW